MLGSPQYLHHSNPAKTSENEPSFLEMLGITMLGTPQHLPFFAFDAPIGIASDTIALCSALARTILVPKTSQK